MRMKAVFAAFVVAAIATTVPSATAQNTASGPLTKSGPLVVAAGSSAMWQSIALAAMNFNGTTGNCAKAKVAVHPPCFHYTGNANFNLNDTRPTLNGLGGSVNVDGGGIWIVWDSPTGTQVRNVWAYIKVDSVVGDRCFFAQPACNITAPSGYVWSTVGNKIPSALWGSDTVPPSDVQALFPSGTSGLLVNTGATDIRPEDAMFAECRVNSALGSGAFGDGLDGLGYGTIASGTCPAFGAPLSQLVGNPIKSGISAATANPLAFNISGTDPFTGTTIPTAVTVDVGADPIVFVVSKAHQLAGATAATDSEVQNIFSGTDCNAKELGKASAGINVYLREPLSGTFNTTEGSVLRRPVETTPTNKVLGVSQEKGVGSTNPLSGTACAGGGGTRTRGIGTAEVVGGVQSSGTGAVDGIAYTFFSFGNVSKIAGSATYGYLTLDGVDPIGPLSGFPNQELPTCTVPCPESSFGGWGTGKSFPSLRAGNYSAWSLLRMVTKTANSTNLTDLVNGSHTYVVNDSPDYIPAIATAGDPGVVIWHTHYQQRDGADNVIGPKPINGAFNTTHNPTGGDKGGDMGGCTISTVGIGSTTKVNFIQTGPGTTCSSTVLRD